MSYSAKLKRTKTATRSRVGRSAGRSPWLVLALVLLLVAAAWRWYQGRAVAQPDSIALAVLEGQATIHRADGRTPTPIGAGQSALVVRGDELRTTADGSARLTLSGGETVELQGETRLEVLQLHRAPATRELVAVFALNRGTAISRMQHGLLQGIWFEIEMHTATVKAKGTAFRCEALANDHAYVLVYDGAVEVSMGPQVVTLQAGQAVDIWLGKPLMPVETGQAIPGGPPEPTAGQAAATATYTEREKTLFPPVVTPTRPGDLPVIPADSEGYTVQSGDTLYSIARQYGLPWQEIWEANKDILTRPESLRAGQVLRIPR